MTWTPDIVLGRLIDACRVIEATTIGDGPAPVRAFMPYSVQTFSEAEWYEFELDDLLTNQGQAVKELKEERRREIERNAARAASASAISMAHEAIRWPAEHIPDDNRRRVLLAFATCRARGGDWSAYLRRRNRRASASSGWSKRTVYRWISQSVQSITEALNNNSVPLRLPADLHVAHEAAISEDNSVASGKYAWMADGAKPLPPTHMGLSATYEIPPTPPKPKAKRSRRGKRGKR